MSRQLTPWAAKLAAQTAIALSVPTTVIALLSGYQRPSNAAIISASTTNAIPTLTAKQSAEKKSRLSSDSDDELEPDTRGWDGKLGVDQCDRSAPVKKNYTKIDPSQICRLKAD